MKNNTFYLLLFFSFSLINAMEPRQAKKETKIIKRIPCRINKSGEYIVDENVTYADVKPKHFDSAIRVFGDVDVAINLNGQTLNAQSRTFGIDANGARSVFIFDGEIAGAKRGVSSLGNNVLLQNITIKRCESSSIETTPEKTRKINVNFSECGNLE